MKLSEIVESTFDFEGLTIILEAFELGSHFDVEKRCTLIKHCLLDLPISSDLYVYLVLQKFTKNWLLTLVLEIIVESDINLGYSYFLGSLRIG